jgi:hypothetical protein
MDPRSRGSLLLSKPIEDRWSIVHRRQDAPEEGLPRQDQAVVKRLGQETYGFVGFFLIRERQTEPREVAVLEHGHHHERSCRRRFAHRTGPAATAAIWGALSQST